MVYYFQDSNPNPNCNPNRPAGQRREICAISPPLTPTSSACDMCTRAFECTCARPMHEPLYACVREDRVLVIGLLAFSCSGIYPTYI